MRAYLAFFRARMGVLLQYRAAALAGVATQFFWGLMRVMIFSAFYAASSSPQPMTLAETTSYIWLSQGLLLLVPWSPDRETVQQIREGRIAYELLRPVDLYSLWFCRALAIRTTPVILRFWPILLFAVLFCGLGPPPSLASLGFFILSLVASLLLGSALTCLMSISLFWTISGEGIARLLPGVNLFFSGQILPLPLFPGFLQGVAAFLPFAGLLDTPLRIYLGHIGPGEVWGPLLHQFGWVVLLVLLGRFLLDLGRRRVVIQGG